MYPLIQFNPRRFLGKRPPSLAFFFRMARRKPASFFTDDDGRVRPLTGSSGSRGRRSVRISFPCRRQQLPVMTWERLDNTIEGMEDHWQGKVKDYVESGGFQTTYAREKADGSMNNGILYVGVDVHERESHVARR